MDLVHKGVRPCFEYVPIRPLRAPTPLVDFLANYRPHLSHFLENAIFAIPTKLLSIYASTLSMWFQAAECNAVNASLLLSLINNNFLIFNRESSHFESLLNPNIRKFATPF